jgi:uncharacterized protein (TIGR02301 family)
MNGIDFKGSGRDAQTRSCILRKRDCAGTPLSTLPRPARAALIHAFVAILVGVVLASVPAEARKKRSPEAPPPASAQDQPAQAPEPQPYRPQMTRLAEILGALTSLDELCSTGRGAPWRASMKALLEADVQTDRDKDLLAGAFNRTYRGYAMTYRACTANARTAIVRFLTEGRRIAHDVVERYGST